MRIISKHQDYYDGVHPSKKDDPNIFLRHKKVYNDKHDKDSEEIPGNHNFPIQVGGPSSFGRNWKSYNNKYDPEGWIKIGFCGKWWNGIHYTTKKRDKDYPELTYDREPHIVYTHKDHIEVLRKTSSKKDFERYMKSEKSRWDKYSDFERDERFFSVNGVEKPNLTEMFRVLGTSVIAIYHKADHSWGGVYFSSEPYVIANPILKDYQFQKVVDPYTAYQEIEMYQFGVIGNIEKETNNIPDKYLISQKGFDEDYGFRTRPGKKKRGKKNVEK